MIFLVLGATGATGRHVAELLLNEGHDIRVIVRSKKRLSECVRKHERCARGNLQSAES